MEWYYILLICIGAVITALFLLAFAVDRIAFGGRCDKNPMLKYFTAEDFGLNASVVEVGARKKLRGFIYDKPEALQNGGVAVFCHGMGAGHLQYTTEIAYLCNLGFKVVALDNAGCNLSDGKIGGMYSGVKTAVKALEIARGITRGKVYLVGHSWGGYSALCALEKGGADGAVAISAPVSPVKTLQCAVSAHIPVFFAKILSPFWAVINFFKFGADGNMNAAESCVKSGAPALLIQGDKDDIVKSEASAYAAADGKNVLKLSVKGRAHNPYLTEAAQSLTQELLVKLNSARSDPGGAAEYLKDFDFSAATQEDGEVMAAIAEFLTGRSVRAH